MITYKNMNTIGDKKIYIQRSLRSMTISDLFIIMVSLIIQARLLAYPEHTVSQETMFFSTVVWTAYLLTSIFFVNFSNTFITDNNISRPMSSDAHVKILNGINSSLKWGLVLKIGILCLMTIIVILLLFNPKEVDYIFGAIAAVNLFAFFYTIHFLGHDFK